MNQDKDIFNFWVPAEMLKASAESDGTRRIKGIASTESRDLQNEVVDLKGISLDYFRSHGVFNDDHGQKTADIVGEPTEVKITKDGLYVEGIVYKGKESSDRIWEHMNSLEQSGAKRKLGFSIEGKVVERQGNKIKKCWLKNIAITPHPVNTSTWAEIAKSFEGAKWVDGSEEEDKAMTTASAGALLPESLEGSKKPQIYKSFSEVPDGVELSFEDCVRTLQLEKGWSKSTAEAVMDCVFIQKGLK
jgi:hypothetical protein